MPTRPLFERPADLTDPRGPKGRVYPFVPLLALCLVALRAGHTSVAAIAPFGRPRGQRLGHALGFRSDRMPCADTRTTPLAALDADALDRALGAWLEDRHAAGWDAERLLELSRAPRGIEDGLHHRRDETSREDRCRVRRGQAARVLASLRDVAVYLLRQADHPSAAAATRGMVAHPDRAPDLLKAAPSTSE